MNSSKFVQTEGYPLTSERLQELQTTFQPFNAFGNLAGNLTIISGCEQSGSTIKNGTIFINGELLEFREASVDAGSTVIILEDVISKPFKNGTVKEVYRVRYATFGTNPDASWPWSSFKRPFETKEIPGNLLTQLSTIPGKADTSTVNALAERVTALESIINNLATPQIQVRYGREIVSSVTTYGDYSNDFTRNYVDVYPPSGFTMSHLKGIIPSIGRIPFDGDVDDNDVTWCNYQLRTDRVRIICGNVEQKASPIVNYLAIWIK